MRPSKKITQRFLTSAPLNAGFLLRGGLLRIIGHGNTSDGGKYRGINTKFVETQFTVE